MNVHVVPSRRKQLTLQDQLYLGQIATFNFSFEERRKWFQPCLKIGITIGNKKQNKAKKYMYILRTSY